MHFSVPHHQLKNTPGQVRMGRKRYDYSKNDCSAGFLLGNSPQFLPQGRSRSSLNYATLPPIMITPKRDSELFKLRVELQCKEQELKQLRTFITTSRSRTPVRPKHTRNLEFLYSQVKATASRGIVKNSPTQWNLRKHSLFQQPKFTKLRPKVVDSNPITGIPRGGGSPVNNSWRV